MLRRGGFAVALLWVLLVANVQAAQLPLTTRLANALAVRGAPAASSGAVAIDLLTGKTLFTRNPDLPLAPASNEKLPVTYAALVELGSTYRFRTEVLGTGHQDGATWQGNVVLKGYGDPTLTSLGLDRLATQLAREGITRIAGRVLGDESWFDSLRTAPGWKPTYFLNESSPLSALVVDRGVYDHHLALQPAVAAAGRFRQLLRRHGISSGPVGLGRASPDAFSLAEVTSTPLRAVLKAMDLESDNFIAEMLLKDLGAEAGGAGSSPAGAAVVLRDLAAAGVPIAGVRIADGSGLSLDDRLTARAIAKLLLVIWENPQLRGPVWAALPVAGVSGTLDDRMEKTPARGAVRAKTGTTDLATALSGYVRDRFAFAVLDNGWPVSWWATRKAQDRFATALAATA